MTLDHVSLYQIPRINRGVRLFDLNLFGIVTQIVTQLITPHGHVYNC